MKKGSRAKTIVVQIWDVLYPAAAIVLCMFIVTVAAIIIAGQVLGIPGASAAELLQKSRSLPLWINVGFYLLTWITQRKQYRMDLLRFQPENQGWGEGKLLAACLLAVSLGHLISTGIAFSGLPEIFTGYTGQAATAFEGQNPILLVISTVILAPLAEEMIFRGMIYRRARNYLGTVGGALVAALLFGIYHGNMIQFLYAFLMGLLFAAFCEKSGSLLPCILAHGAANLWAVFYKMLESFTGIIPIISAGEAVLVIVCIWAVFRKK